MNAVAGMQGYLSGGIWVGIYLVTCTACSVTVCCVAIAAQLHVETGDALRCHWGYSGKQPENSLQCRVCRHGIMLWDGRVSGGALLVHCQSLEVF